MAWSCEQINFEDLKPAKSAEEYALHLAAVEWSLAAPIVISTRDDIKSKVRWRDGFDPYHHQVQNLITFCRRLPVTLLADDVGLGKTISAGLILGELMERKRVSRALVVCPAILGHQWVEELSSKFGIPALFVKGQELTDSLDHADVPVIVTTYASARTRLAGVHREQFDMLILDEAHKLRNLHGAHKPPVMAKRVKEALENRIFKFVLMLTATPIQNRVWDLYSLIDLLTVAKGHRNPLGNPGAFRVRFVDDAAGRRLRPSTASEFRSILRQYIVRTRREGAQLKFPTRQVETRKLTGGEVEARMFQIVRAKIDELSPLVQISLSQAMMSSPQALARQLENMAEKKLIFASTAEEARRFANLSPMTAKLEGLLKLVRELRRERPDDWRLVVFTLRKETQDAIGRALVAEGVKVDFIRGGAAHANQSTVEKFRANPPGCSVIVSTDAGAEGVNLQSGNVLVNYDLPWNPMVLEQRIGRIQRLASRHEHVAIVNLVIADSVEERVVGRLLEKLQAVCETVGDIETILESSGQDDNDSFEEMIRKLVIDSLKGQDVEEATRAATVSIDRAKQLMKLERGNIDRVFGPGPMDSDQGPKPPEFEPRKPSLSAEQFVMRALAAEGTTVRPQPDGAFEVARPGKPIERIGFDPNLDGQSDPPVSYLPGAPAFERLVQRWLDRSGHCVRDVSVDVEPLTLAACKAWCADIGGAHFESHVIKERKRKVIGTVVCRATAANGMDSLEKLIHIEPIVNAPLDVKNAGSTPISRAALTMENAVEDLNNVVTEKVEADADIRAFCRFYERRRFEEIGKAGNDERKQLKIENDMTPKVFAEVVAINGVRHDVARVLIYFRLDGANRYQIEFELLPATGQVLNEPERGLCHITGRMLPAVCLATCSVSGKTAAAHLLVPSTVNGRPVLPEYETAGDLVTSDAPEK